MDKIIKSSKIYDYISNRKEITYTLNDLIKFNDLYELMSQHYELTRTLEKYTDSSKMERATNTFLTYHKPLLKNVLKIFHRK